MLDMKILMSKKTEKISAARNLVVRFIVLIGINWESICANLAATYSTMLFSLSFIPKDHNDDELKLGQVFKVK